MRITTLSDKQREIMRFVVSDKAYLICDGAVRSGKTIIMIMGFVAWAMANYDKTNFAICAKTVSNAERNIVKPFLSLDGSKQYARYHRYEHMLEVTAGGKSNYFYLFGGKDESSYELIQGVTLAGALLDEVALMPQSFVEQCLARTLTYPNAKIWFNCNPEGAQHWFYTNWILPTDNGTIPNAVHLHFLMSDNPIIGAAEIEKAKQMFAGVFYKRYILGLWVAAEGVIYDMFDESAHVLAEPETEGEYFVSSDYGIQNANVFLLWRKERNKQRWVCLREWYYSGRDKHKQKSVSELVDGLQGMLGDIRPKQVIVDPSAAALIVEMRKRGFHVLPAINDVIQGIADVSTLLYKQQLAFTPQCENTIKEFGVYCWDSKAAQHGIDKPIKENDHALDAVRYFVETRHLARKL